MRLLIRAVSLAGQPLTQAITGVFDARGGTIGRSDTCTLMLPDPERHISRVQAEIEHGDRGYTIRNVSHANPILHNGRTVPSGRVAPLGEGDEVQIGSYLLRVSHASQVLGPASPAAVASPPPSSTSPPPVRPAPSPVPVPMPAPVPVPSPMPAPMPVPRAARPSAGPVDDPFAGLGLPSAPSGASSGDPFADLWGTSGPLPLADPLPAPVPAPYAPSPGPFGDLAGPAVRPMAPDLPSCFGDLIPAGPGEASGTGPAGFDAAWGLGPTSPASSTAAVDGFLRAPLPGGAPAGASPGPAAPDGLSLDPLAMFGMAAPAPVAPVRPDRTPEIHAAMPLPEAAVPQAAPAPAPRPAPPARAPEPVPARPEPPRAAPAPLAPAAPPAAAREAAPPDALWAAFCEGAGISPNLPGGASPELMRIVGQMLHHCIDGTVRLVAARTATKMELHAQVTMIQPRNNNPLKFSPDARVALEQLLQPPLRGFLPGPAAVEQAMDDLVGHAFGTMAGMRAALDGVLERFSPDQLEAKLVRQSVLDSLLPMHRRARLWELYLQHFQSVREDAREDFHSLFGKAFLQAYEEQLDRLDASRHPADGDLPPRTP